MSNMEGGAYNQGYAAGYKAGLADGLSGRVFSEEQTGLLHLPLEFLDLSVRTRNALTRCGCVRVEDVTKIPAEQICRIRNLGRKGLDEVTCALHRHGLYHTDWDAFLTSGTIEVP